MSNLANLGLNDNHLQGTIPPELGNLTKLSSLNLANNRLSGSIPTELGRLNALRPPGLSQETNSQVPSRQN